MATIKQIGIYTESSSSWGVHDIGADANHIDFSSTSYRASEVQGALNEIAGRMSATDNSISSIRGDITEIQQEMESLPSSTVFDRINTLSTSVTNLASSVSNLNTNSSNFASSISSLNQKITNNTSAINQRPTTTQVSTMITNGTSSFLPSSSIDSRIAASTKGLATTAYVAGSTSGLATETFVTNKTAGLASQAWVNSQLSSTVSVLQAGITANSNFVNSFATKPMDVVILITGYLPNQAVGSWTSVEVPVVYDPSLASTWRPANAQWSGTSSSPHYNSRYEVFGASKITGLQASYAFHHWIQAYAKGWRAPLAITTSSGVGGNNAQVFVIGTPTSTHGNTSDGQYGLFRAVAVYRRTDLMSQSEKEKLQNVNYFPGNESVIVNQNFWD